VLQAGFLSAQTSKESLDRKISKAAAGLICPIADEQNPVTLNSMLVTDFQGDSIAVIVKANLAKGWHIYAFVPENQPYIVTECLLEPDANLQPVGKWVKSAPIASNTDKGVFIYENTAFFIHKMKKKSKNVKGKISTGLYYQTCNLQQCLPPIEVKMEVAY
jgi:hypothetical protein